MNAKMGCYIEINAKTGLAPVSTELKYVYGILHYFSRELIYRPDTWTRNNTWSIVRQDKATLVCQIRKSLN